MKRDKEDMYNWVQLFLLGIPLNQMLVVGVRIMCSLNYSSSHSMEHYMR